MLGIYFPACARKYIYVKKTTTTEQLRQGNPSNKSDKNRKKISFKKMATKAGKVKKEVGSVLGINEDIDRRKQVTNTKFFKLKQIFTNKNM